MAKRLQISIRKKLLRDGKTASLYLDFNRQIWNESKNKSERYKFLELYIYLKPKTKVERDHNNFVNEKADIEKLEVYKEIIDGTYGLVNKEAEYLNADFLKFFEELGEKKEAKSTRNIWKISHKHFSAFMPACKMRQLSPKLLSDFKDFLNTQTADRKTEKISNNSKYIYFSTLRAAVAEAYKLEFIPKNITEQVDNYALKTTKREYFSEEEIALLRNTPLEKSPVLYRAAFFSILTSLRWNDIRHLRYEQIRFTNALGWHIDFEIKKTERPDILYLGEEALSFCEYEEKKIGLIFPMSYQEKDKLSDWYKAAGAPKKTGGFHIFRHTFAVRMLNKGESLQVIKELMGHKSVKTTEHYAQMLGITKKTAAESISLK